jgi:hypothetical protein
MTDGTKRKPPAAPKGTAAAGRGVWSAVLEDWELEPHELALLTEITRTVDMLDQLAGIVATDGPIIESNTGPRAHPALVEARQLRITLARLYAALRLPDGEQGHEGQGRRQRRVGARGVYQLRSAS